MHYLMIFLVLVAAGAALARRVRQRNAALLKHLRKLTPYVDIKAPANLKEPEEK